MSDGLDLRLAFLNFLRAVTDVYQSDTGHQPARA